MSILPALIGISIHEKKYHYLSWIPSESGPLIIDYGTTKIETEIPFDYFFNRIKAHNVEPRFTLSLSNNYVKYNFTKLYKDSLINRWNSKQYYDKVFHDSYDSYIYKVISGQFSIHILKTIKENIINQIKSKNYTLTNLGVGIFSTLAGIKSWYNIKNINKYIVIKLSKNNILELLFIDNNLLTYVFVKKKNNNFHITDFYGNEKQKSKTLMTIESIFKQNVSSIDYERIFYYSIEGNKDDIASLSSIDSDKVILINPFKKLTFDDSCRKNLTKINLSRYSELGNAFEGVDV